MQTSSRYLIIALTGMLAISLTAGCGVKKEPPTPKPEVGVLNMTKAIKAHPRYSEVEKLQNQRASLLAQLSQQQRQLASASYQAGLDLTNLTKATDHEFQTKMAGKHNELNLQLQAQAEALRQEVSRQVDKYIRELDQSYRNRNFALQVKLKTIDLSKEEQASIQKQMDELQNERMGKIVAYQQQLTDRMSEQMKQAEQAAAKQLDSYAQQVKKQLDAEFAKKSQAMKNLPGAALAVPSGSDSVEAKLESTEHELTKLQQDIVIDVKKRAAAVATAKGLATVLADVEIFTAAAQDITTDVIAGSK